MYQHTYVTDITIIFINTIIITDIIIIIAQVNCLLTCVSVIVMLIVITLYPPSSSSTLPPLPLPQGKLDGSKPLEEVDNVSDTVKDVSASLFCILGVQTFPREASSNVTHARAHVCRVYSCVYIVYGSSFLNVAGVRIAHMLLVLSVLSPSPSHTPTQAVLTYDGSLTPKFQYIAELRKELHATAI